MTLRRADERGALRVLNEDRVKPGSGLVARGDAFLKDRLSARGTAPR